MRNLGLDIYRSLAIIMVFIAHAFAFYGYWYWLGLHGIRYNSLAQVFGTGVEIFFALSGFLIGGILLRDVVEDRNERNAPKKLATFWVRRWMRTLPLYYLMVVVTCVYPWAFQLAPALISPLAPNVWKNLLFIQNFDGFASVFQPVSWSLAIEEWFYLLVPLCMVLISFVPARSRRARLLLMYALVIIVASLAYRTSDFLIHHTNWGFETRSQIFMRMDSLMFGVLAAWLRFYARAVYVRVARNLALSGIALLGLLALLGYIYVKVDSNTIDNSFVGHTILFTGMGSCCAVLLMALEFRLPGRASTPAWWARPWHYISNRSYGYYLIHWPVGQVLVRYLVVGNKVNNLMLTMAGIICTGVIAELCYRFYEQPILRLRDYFFKSAKAEAARLSKPQTGAPASNSGYATREPEHIDLYPTAPVPVRVGALTPVRYGPMRDEDGLEITQKLPRASSSRKRSTLETGQ